MRNTLTIRTILLFCVIQLSVFSPTMSSGLANAASLDSQQQTTKIIISGVVKDASGLPLPGVTVAVKGTTIGTMTDINGIYTIKLSEKAAKLSFSFVGMKSQEIAIGSRSIINVTLESVSHELQEVVAIGYGTQRRSDLTGSVASLSSKDIASSGATTIEQALSGRAAGVIVNAADNAPGAGMTIQIRGANSISASSAPLYVIDGFPVEGAYSSGNNGTLTASSPLSNIDPNDIESIDILKDASATAVYGARGANGVVIITTKSGKDGKVKVSFNANYGVQQMANKNTYVPGDTKFYAQAQHDRDFLFDKRIATPTSSSYGYQWWNVAPYSSPDSTNTNWLDAVTRTGNTQNYNISMSAGSNKGNYAGIL